MDKRIIPDLSISADVAIEQAEAAPLIPIEAVFYEGDLQSPPSPSSKPYVYAKDATGWRRRDVEIGLKSFTHAIVKSGLKQGEEIALNAPEKPKPEDAGQPKG